MTQTRISPFARRILATATIFIAAARPASGQMQQATTRPAISHDGHWILYQAARDGNWDIYVARIDGSDERRVSAFSEKNFAALGPATWLAGDILVPRRTADGAQLTIFPGPGASGESRLAGPVPRDARAIRASPGGRRIVFVRGPGQHPTLAVAAIDGSDLRDLPVGAGAVINPDWSPDGSSIAFTLADSAGALGDSAATGTLMIVKSDGTGLRRVAAFSAADGVPIWANWSPDGRQIAVQSGNYVRPRMEDKSTDLWIIDVSSGRATKLAPHPATPFLNEAPAWFPDGSRLAFQSNRGGSLEIWTMKPDGTDVRRLTDPKPPGVGDAPSSAFLLQCTLQDGWKKDFIPAEDRDYSRARLTQGGLYRISIKAPADQPPMGKLHQWTLHIEDTTGTAVEDATICVDGGMPEHGHGLPTKPEMSSTFAHGDYPIDGMKFTMSGWWVVKFVVRSTAGTDTVRFNLRLRDK